MVSIQRRPGSRRRGQYVLFTLIFLVMVVHVHLRNVTQSIAFSSSSDASSSLSQWLVKLQPKEQEQQQSSQSLQQQSLQNAPANLAQKLNLEPPLDLLVCDDATEAHTCNRATDCHWCEHGEHRDGGLGRDFYRLADPRAPAWAQCMPVEKKCRTEWPWPKAPTSTKTATTQAQANNGETSLPPLQLHVPFYVYPELVWLDDVTVDGLPIQEYMSSVQYVRYTEDVWFAKAVLQHPQRTHEPNQAKLFVIPTLFNTVAHVMLKRQQFCWRGYCNQDLARHVHDILIQSEWFQRHKGMDHVLVGSHPAVPKLLQKYASFKQCNVIGLENQVWNQHPDRITLPSIHVGQACPRQPKRADFVLIGDLDDTKLPARGNVCHWLQTSPALGEQNRSLIAQCGPSLNHESSCPAMAQARFGLHVPSRQAKLLGEGNLMDAILSGTVPIFTDQTQYGILPSWYEWEDISYFADASDETSFVQAISDIASDANVDDYHKKLVRVLQNRPLFDWTTLVPTDTYLFYLSVRLWPDEARDRPTLENPFGALKLPGREQKRLSIKVQRGVGDGAGHNPLLGLI